MNYTKQTIFVFISVGVSSFTLCVIFAFFKLLLKLVPILLIGHMAISSFISLMILQPSFVLIALLNRMKLLNNHLSETLLFTVNPKKSFKVLMVTCNDEQRDIAGRVSVSYILVYDIINLFNGAYGFGVSNNL